MAQKTNSELIENLRPYIARIARNATGNIVSPDGTQNSLVLYDNVLGSYYNVFLKNGKIYIMLASGESKEDDVQKDIDDYLLKNKDDEFVWKPKFPTIEL